MAIGGPGPHANSGQRETALRTNHQYQIVEVTAGVADRAMELAEKHGLRGYDAVHLASALALQQMREAMGLPALTFVSADARQRQAAVAEVFLVEDPNEHR